MVAKLLKDYESQMQVLRRKQSELDEFMSATEAKMKRL